MASNLGTVFVELSLDDKIYKQRLSEVLTSSTATAKGIETSWKALGTKSAEAFDAQRRAAENAYALIKNAATSTFADITRAQEAMGAKIKDINNQMGNVSTFDKLKANWVAVGAAVAGAMVTIHKAHELMREGAKALQTELAFKNTAQALGFDPEKYVAELKRVTNATIDDSDLMQKAMKGITGGIDPDDMLKLAEV